MSGIDWKEQAERVAKELQEFREQAEADAKMLVNSAKLEMRELHKELEEKVDEYEAHLSGLWKKHGAFLVAGVIVGVLLGALLATGADCSIK